MKATYEILMFLALLQQGCSSAAKTLQLAAAKKLTKIALKLCQVKI
jgi:hypothetical protein